MIWVLHFKKSGLGNIELLRTREHMKIKKIHNYFIDLNK